MKQGGIKSTTVSKYSQDESLTLLNILSEVFKTGRSPRVTRSCHFFVCKVTSDHQILPTFPHGGHQRSPDFWKKCIFGGHQRSPVFLHF